MAKLQARVPVQQTVVGQEIQVEGYTLQPVVQITGQRSWNEQPNRQGAWMMLRVTPVEVVTRDREGREQRIAVQDPEQAALVGLGTAALVMAVVSLIIVSIRRLVR